MSTEVALLGSRKIARLGVHTPLVVPSFSSRGFPEVGQLLALLRDDLYGVCLLSAFDVARQHVQIALPDIADVLVLDSGVYETTAMMVAADLHAPPPSGSNWSRADYRATLATLTEATNALVVSFDHYGPLEQQVVLAREDFAQAARAATDFLVKPDDPKRLLDIAAVLTHAEELAHFDVLGVTEKELGDSLVARCVALRQLRRGLSGAGLDCPIHVFGAVTPGVMLAYLMSGADIFDGLNWLRYDYSQPGLTCLAEPTIDDPLWDRPDCERCLSRWRRNLTILQKLQEAMRCYAEGGSSDVFRGIGLSEGVVAAARRIVTAAAAADLSTKGDR